MEMRLRTPVTRGLFCFFLGALRLVNEASLQNIDQEKISSGTQGRSYDVPVVKHNSCSFTKGT